MRKHLLFILSIFAAGTLAAQSSVPNGNFEKWDSVLWQEPNFYFTSNAGNDIPVGAPVNVIQTAPKFGTYGIQLSTIKFGPDTLFAYITNSNGNPIQGQGGIPYNQQATGVRFYYQCNTTSVGLDTAVAVFVFKNSGNIIGTYIYKLYGNISTYTLNASTFSPALPMAPDTVIFAAVSSIGPLENQSGLPGSTLTLDSITFTGVTSQPALMNGSFENWTQDSIYNPTGWQVSNYGPTRTTDKYNGQYAMELTTGTNPNQGGQIQSAYATTGQNINLNNHHDTIIGGYPFSNQIDSLVFYYKYDTAAYGDTANVGLQFNKNSSVIFWSGAPITASATYKRMSVPFNIPSTPDSVIVSFESSQSQFGNVNPKYNGTVLKVDSVHFGSQIITGIRALSTIGNIQMYPNPTNGLFYVNLQGFNGSLEQISVFDMSGRMIETTNYAFAKTRNSIEQIDMSGFATGTYLVKIGTSQGIKYEKVSKL
ncbi:MAG TPA: T9SS type A sorting domain-containing protein [Bacteroidia bacterium]|jgi:hypothetical protein|nr:T9SS type A sorting domain-containing protein [Bacteroidia bacterium]